MAVPREMTFQSQAQLLWTIAAHAGDAAGRCGRVRRAEYTWPGREPWLGAVLCLNSGVFPGAEGQQFG